MVDDILKIVTWVNRNYTIGILTKRQFKKFTKDKKLVEVGVNELFMNNELIFWKRDFFYDKKLFLDMKKLASCLGSCTVALMPDTKESFPMFIECDGLYVVLAPKDISKDNGLDIPYLDVYFPKEGAKA